MTAMTIASGPLISKITFIPQEMSTKNRTCFERILLYLPRFFLYLESENYSSTGTESIMRYHGRNKI